jgi:hypothetical protein
LPTNVIGALKSWEYCDQKIILNCVGNFNDARFRKIGMGYHKTNLDSVYFENQRQMCTITK